MMLCGQTNVWFNWSHTAKRRTIRKESQQRCVAEQSIQRKFMCGVGFQRKEWRQLLFSPDYECYQVHRHPGRGTGTVYRGSLSWWAPFPTGCVCIMIEISLGASHFLVKFDIDYCVSVIPRKRIINPDNFSVGKHCEVSWNDSEVLGATILAMGEKKGYGQGRERVPKECIRRRGCGQWSTNHFPACNWLSVSSSLPVNTSLWWCPCSDPLVFPVPWKIQLLLRESMLNTQKLWSRRAVVYCGRTSQRSWWRWFLQGQNGQHHMSMDET